MNYLLIKDDLYSISKDEQIECLCSYLKEQSFSSIQLNQSNKTIDVSNINKDDQVICYSLLVLGSCMDDILYNIEIILNKGSSLLIFNKNIYLSNDITNERLSSVFALLNRLSKSYYSEITKESLMRKKLKGDSLGRPKGTYRNNSTLNKYIEEIEEALLIEHESVLSLSKRYKVKYGTMIYFIKNNFPLYKSKIALNKDKKDKY